MTSQDAGADDHDEGPDSTRAASRWERPTWPAADGSWSDVGPSYAMTKVPSAWRDLRAGLRIRVFVGLAVLAFPFIALTAVLGDDSESSWLLHHVATKRVRVVSTWYTSEFRGGTTFHVEVALAHARTSELHRFDGEPQVGDEISVLVDPRNGQVWEVAAARGAADPGALPTVIGVVLAACGIFAAWLVLRPSRLRRRAARSRSLMIVQGDVTDVRPIVDERRPRRRPPASSSYVTVTDARGGQWLFELPSTPSESADSLAGCRATIVQVGRPRRPNAGALLLVSGVPAQPGGQKACWWSLRSASPQSAIDIAVRTGSSGGA